uniref:tryptophan--tRNA ligase n=1 Tax=Globodera rostochiensis TaxID=31243 RepID=A0A914HAJ5_GLORO
MSKVFVSGIQPSGSLHIGNYLGFIKSFVAFQNDLSITRRVLLIADLHSISTGRQEPAQLRLNTLRTLAALLACGRTLLVQQSRLPEHTELMWILGSAATVTSLSSLAQFKDKSAWYPEGVAPVGLLTYPLLQAADVLTYRATHVPVGDDQTQHMELVRHLATKFNLRYRCDFFPVPEKISGTCARLRSLRNPSVKMSKSDTDTKSRIDLMDTPELTIAKIRKAVTDFESRVTFDPEQRPGVSNLVTLFSLFSGLLVEQVLKQCDGLDTLAFKGKLAELINSQLAPIRERFSQFVGDERELERLLQYGEERSRPIAVDTLKEVKKIVGMR